MIAKKEVNNKHTKLNNYIYLVLGIAIVLIGYLLISGNLSGPQMLNLNVTTSNVTNIYPLNTTFFSVNLKNTGNNQINDLLVAIYLQNTTLHAYNVTLPPGKNITIPFNYTYASYGNYLFRFIADPTHVFNVSNRSKLTQSIAINVSKPYNPSKILGFNTKNVTSIYNFSFLGSSMPLVAIQTGIYNLSKLNTIFSVASNTEHITIGDLYGGVYSATGTYVQYSNDSSAEGILFSGLGPYPVEKIIGSFGYKNYIHNNKKIFIVSNHTLMCVGFVGGWTELLIYNGIQNNCSTSPNNAAYSTMINKSVFSNYNLTHYVQGLRYTNSTDLGLVYGFDKNTSYWYNIFNNTYGIFISGISLHSNSTTQKQRCYGLLSNNSAVCSVYLNPILSTTSSYGIIDSEELTRNYNISLYSIVNNTQFTTAHYNAVQVIHALNLTQKPLLWQSAINNTCKLNTNAISCYVLNFSLLQNSAVLKITNNLNSNIKLTSYACYISGLKIQEPINQTILTKGSNIIDVNCKNIPVPIVSAETIYNLTITYINKNQSYNTSGFLNVSNTV